MKALPHHHSKRSRARRRRTRRFHSRLGLVEWVLFSVIGIAVAVTIAMALFDPS